MEKFQKSVKEFMIKGRQSAPDRPTEPSTDERILRAKMTIEEAVETSDAFGVEIIHWVDTEYGRTGRIVKMENLTFVDTGKFDIVEVADGVSDQIVIAVGNANCIGVDIEPVMDEVLANNMLKVINPKFREDGKLIKPEGHPRPDIKRIIDKQR